MVLHARAGCDARPSDKFGHKATASRRFWASRGGLDPEEEKYLSKNYLDPDMKIQAG